VQCAALRAQHTLHPLFITMMRPAPVPPFASRSIALGSWVVLVTFLALVAGCGRSHPGPPNLPQPTPSTTVGPGDVFEVSVLGEKDLPKEYRVQPDGTVEFPYVDRLVVADLEPQQIEDLIKKQLVEHKILTNPQVTLVVKQYNSKKISVIGAVQKPGSLAWTEGIKLVDAISLAGGFTSIADADHVLLTRVVAGGKTVTAAVSVDDITEGKQADVPLQAGDTIKVSQRVF
jgi:protein involved in polysaccharide export with SLBB domain